MPIAVCGWEMSGVKLTEQDLVGDCDVEVPK